MEVWPVRDSSAHTSMIQGALGLELILKKVEIFYLIFINSNPNAPLVFQLLLMFGFQTFRSLYVFLLMQAAYFVSQGFRRRDKRSNMLLVSHKLTCS